MVLLGAGRFWFVFVSVVVVLRLGGFLVGDVGRAIGLLFFGFAHCSDCGRVRVGWVGVSGDENPDLGSGTRARDRRCISGGYLF